jgi:hypothetical protein
LPVPTRRVFGSQIGKDFFLLVNTSKPLFEVSPQTFSLFLAGAYTLILILLSL